MRCSLLVVVSACGSGGNDETPHAVAPPPAHVIPPPRPITSVHGNAITVLGVSEDGLAAVSADSFGAMRLWPAFDAKHEPIVIGGPAPRALGLDHDGDGFVIADLDAAGGVELIRLSTGGEVRSRARLGSEQPVVDLVMMPAGVLVVRADQAIELYDTHATRKLRLVPDNGMHLVSIAARHGHALAVVMDDHVVRGRWIDLERNAWGDQTPILPILPEHVVLSPDHRTIGALRASDHRPFFIDTTTGKLGKRWCSNDEGGEELVEPFSAGAPTLLGFVDDKTAVCVGDNLVAWWTTDGKRLVTTGIGVSTVVADQRVINGAGVELQLATQSAVQYLGYQTRDYSHLRVSVVGLVVGKGDHELVELDDHFHMRARIELPKAPTSWIDVVPIDARYMLTLSMEAVAGDAWGPSARIALYDTMSHEVQLMKYKVRESEIAYDPTTNLLATSDGSVAMLLRWEPKEIKLTAPMRLQPAPGGLDNPTLHLLDPVLAGGLAALAIHESAGTLTVDELHGDDLHPGMPLVPRRTYRLPGELRAVDRAGRIYIHGATDREMVVVYTSGHPTALLDDMASARLRPSPDGTHVIGFDGAKVSLFDAATGHRVWETPLWGLTDVVWTQAGGLVARFLGGLANLDPPTGTLLDRQCGWDFGLSVSPHEAIAEAPIVCDVAP